MYEIEKLAYDFALENFFPEDEEQHKEIVMHLLKFIKVYQKHIEDESA